MLVFKTVEDLRDQGLMQRAIKRLRRQKKPSAFLFKARCAAMDGEPVLVLAPPGKPINRALMRPVRVGTLSIKGSVQREGHDLVFTTETEVNKQRMIMLLAKIGEQNQARAEGKIKLLAFEILIAEVRLAVRREFDLGTDLVSC